MKTELMAVSGETLSGWVTDGGLSAGVDEPPAAGIDLPFVHDPVRAARPSQSTAHEATAYLVPFGYGPALLREAPCT